MLGSIQGKVWGTTQRLFDLSNVLIERISVKKGWRCSDHLHEHRHNLFFVETGRLLVHCLKDDLHDDIILTAGQSTVIKAGDRHYFEALEDTIAFEVYWIELDPGDIRRFVQGGKAPKKST